VLLVEAKSLGALSGEIHVRVHFHGLHLLLESQVRRRPWPPGRAGTPSRLSAH
jgi:hypothetical protein